MKKNIFWSLCILFLIYNVKYIFLFGLGTSHLIIFIVCISAFFVGARFRLRHSIFAVGLIILSLLSVAINIDVGFDLIYVRFAILVLVSLISANALIKVFCHDGKRPYELFKFYGYAAFINSFFIFLMFLSPSFKSMYLSVLNLEITEIHGDSIMDSMLALRLVGVTGFSAYSTAFNQMLCLILYYIYATYYREGDKKLRFFDYMIIFSVTASSLIVSRSTVVGLGVIVVLMLFDRKNIVKNFLFLLTAVFILVALLSSLSYIMSDEQFSFFYNWVFEFFDKGLKAGSVESNLSMYRYSWDDFTLLGDARMNDEMGGYYMHTDVGYFRMLFSAGYIGVMFLVFMIFLILKPIGLQYSKRMMFSSLIILYTFIFLLKGSIITDSSHFFVTMFLCSYVLLKGSGENNTGDQK
ncbi:hypothetical protein J2S82_003193 [Aeromonas caviae]|uniref:hypothetical protein n=1 Tax=Aeromonas caviae TaxID=648 RepID=UPI00209E5648|nr:hypothetical protein [Aeromonas caviae]MCP1601236.1 hypothetical protein [Aeromonas caviae]